MRVILASASPRRTDILKQIGADFEIIPSHAKEIYQSVVPSDIVMELSSLKAEDIAASILEPALIIGADTVVSYHNKILGKPRDKEDAYQMLKALAGETHEVYTGVTLLIKNDTMKKITFAECTKVTVCGMSDEQIEDYIQSGEPFDKAGAYGIQGKFAAYIKEINGDYYNVVGLPVSRICQELQSEGIELNR